jgi:hypothetical protein
MHALEMRHHRTYCTLGVLPEATADPGNLIQWISFHLPAALLFFSDKFLRMEDRLSSPGQNIHMSATMKPS